MSSPTNQRTTKIIIARDLKCLWYIRTTTEWFTNKLFLKINIVKMGLRRALVLVNGNQILVCYGMAIK